MPDLPFTWKLPYMEQDSVKSQTLPHADQCTDHWAPAGGYHSSSWMDESITRRLGRKGARIVRIGFPVFAGLPEGYFSLPWLEIEITTRRTRKATAAT